jgi:hypothetical protein
MSTQNFPKRRTGPFYTFISLFLEVMLIFGPAYSTMAAEWGPGSLTEQARFSEAIQEFTSDALIPVWHDDRALLFINPRLTLTEDIEEEINLGVGLRYLFPEAGLIAGGNIYYDSRYTEFDNQFDQIGFGGELLSKWVDARFNLYCPQQDRVKIGETEQVFSTYDMSEMYGEMFAEDHAIKQEVSTRIRETRTTRVYEFFEEPLQGYDAEVGVRFPGLPNWLDTRVFIGRYDFETPFSQEDMEGTKARLEVRTASPFTLDAECFETKVLNGADYYVGCRLQLPFNFGNIFSGQNPFEGTREAFRSATRPLMLRMGEMVLRDPRIKMEQSGAIEDETRQAVAAETYVVQGGSKVIMPDVNFVDDDATPGGDGRAEAPYQDIQSGVNNAFGERNVYVYEGNYNQNVAVNATTKLYGAGKPIPGHGGRTFGSGVAPVLDATVAGTDGPGMRIQAHDVLVQGFNITRSGGVNAPGNDLIFGTTPIADVGVLAENADNLDLNNNTLNGHSLGAVIVADATHPGGGGPALEFNFNLQSNQMNNGTMGGAMVRALGGSGSFTAIVEDNTFNNTGGSGLTLLPDRFDSLHVEVNRNQANANVVNGIHLQSMSNLTGNATVVMNDNRASENGGGGPGVGILGALGTIGGDFLMQTDGNTVNSNAGVGIAVSSLGVGGNTAMRANNNVVTHNDQMGMVLVSGPVGGNAQFEISGNMADTNGAAMGGGAIAAVALDVGGNLSAVINSNRASDSGLQGIYFIANQVGGDLDVQANANWASANRGSGIVIEVRSNVVGSASIEANDNRASNNGPGGFGGMGILGLLTDVGGDFQVTADGNTVNSNAASGMVMSAQTVGGNARLQANGNTVTHNGVLGLGLVAFDVAGNAQVEMCGNVADTNGTLFGEGVGAAVQTVGGDLNAVINSNSASGCASHGVYFANLQVGGDVNLQAIGNRAESNGGGGLFVSLSPNVAGSATIEMSHNQASGNGLGARAESGIHGQLGDVVGNLSVVMNNNNASGNTSNGISLATGVVGGNANLQASGNTTDANGARGIQLVHLAPLGGNATVTINNNRSSSNVLDGIRYGASHFIVGNAQVAATGNTAVVNGGNGVLVDLGDINGSGSFRFDGLKVSNNASNGLNVAVGVVSNNASFYANRVTANNNGWGGAPEHGIRFATKDIYGDLEVDLLNSSVNSNALSGVSITYSNITGTATTRVQNSTISWNGRDGLRLEGGDIGGPAGFTFDNVQVSNNRSNGMFVTVGNVSNAASYAITRVMANNNGQAGDGVGMVLFLQDTAGDLTLRVNDNIATGNTQGGIGVIGGVIGGNADIQINRNTSSSNLVGMLTLCGGVASNATFEVIGNTVRDNDHIGLSAGVLGVGGDLAARVNGNTVVSNHYDGLKFTAMAIGGDAFIQADTNRTVGNGTSFDSAFGADIAVEAISGNLQFLVRGNESSGNSYGGISAFALSVGGNASLDLSGNTATYNDGYSLASNTSDGVIGMIGDVHGDLTATVSNNTAFQNDGDGVGFYAVGISNNMSIVANNNRSYSNILDGLMIMATGVTGVASISGEGNVLTGNGSDGLELDVLGAGSPTIDFGGGALGSAGNNSIFGNTDYGVFNIGGPPMSLESNYWGGAAPTQAAIPPADLSVGATTPGTYLTLDPNP